MKTTLNYGVEEVRRILADHDGSRRTPRFCGVCHLRHPCDVYALAEDVINLASGQDP
jgi:hypothetical protein